MKTNDIKTMKIPITMLLCIMGLMTCINKAGATVDTWTGSGASGLWSLSGNWSLGSAPSSSDTASIPSSYAGSHAPVLDGSDVALGLVIASGQTVTVSTGYGLTVGASGISGAGTLDLSAFTGTISVAGDVTISGVTPGSASTVALNGSVAQNLSANTFANLQVDNGTGVTMTGSVTVNGTLNGTGTLSAGAHTLTIGGNMTVSAFNCNTSLVILNGSSTQNISAYTFYNLEVDNSSVALANPEIVDANLTGSATLAGVSGGTLTVDGNMSVTSYSASTSSVILNGSSNQNIAKGYTFYNLTLNNSAGATLTGGNVTITNTFTLNSGILKLGNNNFIITPTSGGLAGTYGTSSYIMTNGTGYLTMPATSGGVIYPIGDSYNPLNISDPGAHTFSVRVVDTVSDSLNHLVTDWSVNRTWVVTSASTTTGITVTPQWVEPGDLAGSHFDNTKAFVATRDVTHTYKWTPGANTDISALSNPYSLQSGTLTFTGGDVYNVGVGIGTASPLPVSLIAFNAIYKNDAVNLTWQTASEINNSHFDVERSTDATNWTAIGQVQGNGTSQVMNSYAYTDDLSGIVPAGTIYYRLAQVDFNGATTYSYIRTVNLNPAPAMVQAWPNPTNNLLNVSWMSYTNDAVTVRVTDLSGKELYKETASGKGVMNKQIDLSAYQTGTYFMQIVSADNTVSKLIVRQ